MNAEKRFWDRERIARSLRKGVPIPEIARQHGMTTHQLRCILRAINAIADMKGPSS